MKGFDYSTPSTVHQAVALLSRPGAMPLAGGTDLLVQMRAGAKSPKLLVDLSELGLNYVRCEMGVIHIGALTTFAQILDSEIIRQYLDCLVEAAAEIGCVQTRNLATIGGNLCSAVPSADAAPPLLVLDARLKIIGCNGERSLALDEFFIGPKMNALQPGELLTEIQIPIPSSRTGTCFLKIGRRKAMTLAVVNVAALVSLDSTQRVIENARIALGAVAPTPWRALQAERLLNRCEISDAAIERAACTAAEEVMPISDLRATTTYRRETSRVLTQRALRQAWQRAKTSG